MPNPNPSQLADVRRDFPGLRTSPIRYFDSASTSLKPRAVLASLCQAYRKGGNAHRGVHGFSRYASQKLESSRQRVAQFLGASFCEEIVFTSGTTASLNMLAQTLGPGVVGPGDEVLVTQLEHHSNLLPWRLLCDRQQARLVTVPVDESGAVSPKQVADKLTARTKLVCITHASNVNGFIVEVARIAELAKQVGALVVVDGAQAVAHLPVNVTQLGCDFYCFSAHKLLGPFGVGVLWGKKALWNALPPWQVGGGMVLSVQGAQPDFLPPPHRFEAGTLAIAEVIACAEAIDYVSKLGFAAIADHEALLLSHMKAQLGRIPGVCLLSPAGDCVPVLSFTVKGIHPHDVGTALDLSGFAVRTGLHCAEPFFGARRPAGSVRASLSLYNTVAEIDALAGAVEQIAVTLR